MNQEFNSVEDFFDFLRTTDIDETPEESEPVDNQEVPAQGSLIEQVITNFLTSCASEGSLPSLKQAKVILLLDTLISKYND